MLFRSIALIFLLGDYHDLWQFPVSMYCCMFQIHVSPGSGLVKYYSLFEIMLV